MRKAYEIPGIVNSLRTDVENGSISIRQAAVELASANHIPYIDEELAMKKLGIYEKEKSK